MRTGERFIRSHDKGDPARGGTSRSGRVKTDRTGTPDRENSGDEVRPRYAASPSLKTARRTWGRAHLSHQAYSHARRRPDISHPRLRDGNSDRRVSPKAPGLVDTHGDWKSTSLRADRPRDHHKERSGSISASAESVPFVTMRGPAGAPFVLSGHHELGLERTRRSHPAAHAECGERQCCFAAR